MAAAVVQTSVHGVGFCGIEELLRDCDRYRGGVACAHGATPRLGSARSHAPPIVPRGGCHVGAGAVARREAGCG
jgi:hypothetical protein